MRCMSIVLSTDVIVMDARSSLKGDYNDKVIKETGVRTRVDKE